MVVLTVSDTRRYDVIDKDTLRCDVYNVIDNARSLRLAR